MSFVLIDGPDRATGLVRTLARREPFALDCEAAGFHRYTDRLCLVQITTADETDWILDPLAFDIREILSGPVEDPDHTVIMHGADYDIRLLDRDLDLRIRGLFDTQAAAALLGESALGLANLLEEHLQVKLAKKYQRADWAKRPLPEDMLDYAANDTRHLHALAERLRRRLEEKDRLDWAREEFRELEGIRWEGDPDEDPVIRVKGARDLEPRAVTALRAALDWRDSIARDLDRAPFRVAGDPVLLDIARERPSHVDQLASMKGMNGRLARDEGTRLIHQLRDVERLPDDQLLPYPRLARNGPGRPPPEVEELADRLKSVRNRRAEALSLDRGTLLSNAMLLEIARAEPGSREKLAAVPGMKSWQVEALGQDLLEVLRR